MTKDEKLKLALAASRNKPVVSSFVETANPLSLINQTMPTESTFTRESEGVPITTVAIPTGNKAPYFARVKYSLIDSNPYNARNHYNTERIHKFSSELKSDGQLVPGIATIRNGRFILAAGHYRWKGIGVANIGYMDLMIHEDITDKDLYKMSYKENIERKEQTPLDNAISWKKLLDDGVYLDQTALSEEIGMSLSNITKTLNILKLPPKVVDLISENPDHSFGLSPLYELSLYYAVTDEDKTVSMVLNMINENYGRSQIAAARAAIEEPKKPRKQKENSRQYKILSKQGDASIGSLKEFSSGKVLLEVQIADDEERNLFLEKIKDQLNYK